MPMPVCKTLRIFRFGVFELDEAAGELRKGGIRIKLHSQPFQMLVMLLERHSQVVTREEMRNRLWGRDTFVDFDHGLNASMNKIREALNDSASQPRYVETIPGKGYRFVVPVTVVAPVSNLSEPAAAASAAAESAKTSESPSELLVGAVLAAPHELPVAPRKLVRTLLLLVQAMYLAFYLGALANLKEIHDIFWDARLLSPAALMTLLVATAATLIPVRLFIAAAVSFDAAQLTDKFHKLFPVLLLLDLLWALSPFLLVHHISIGLALGMSAALIYMPFVQRSLILMFARKR